MNSSSDVTALFRRFDGSTSQYKELAREKKAQTARAKWPLLMAIDVASRTAIAYEDIEQPAFVPHADVDAGTAVFSPSGPESNAVQPLSKSAARKALAPNVPAITHRRVTTPPARPTHDRANPPTAASDNSRAAAPASAQSLQRTFASLQQRAPKRSNDEPSATAPAKSPSRMAALFDRLRSS